MIPALPASVGFRQTVSASKRVKFAPPSVDFHSPYGGRPGARVTVPPVTELSPRMPRVDPTYNVLPSTTIDEMERPLNAGPVYAGAVLLPNVPGRVPNTASQLTFPEGTLVFAARCVHVLPPSVDM